MAIVRLEPPRIRACQVGTQRPRARLPLRLCSRARAFEDFCPSCSHRHAHALCAPDAQTGVSHRPATVRHLPKSFCSSVWVGYRPTRRGRGAFGGLPGAFRKDTGRAKEALAGLAPGRLVASRACARHPERVKGAAWCRAGGRRRARAAWTCRRDRRRHGVWHAQVRPVPPSPPGRWRGGKGAVRGRRARLARQRAQMATRGPPGAAQNAGRRRPAGAGPLAGARPCRPPLPAPARSK